MARRTALGAALATTLFLAGAAAGDPGSEKARIDTRIGDLKAQAERAVGTEGVLTNELSGLSSQVRAAEAAVNAEEARLYELEAALAAERARLASLERQIDEQTARLVILEREYDTALARLEQRLRDIYESDSPDLIAFALGTTSFSDLLDNLELLNRIGRQDEQIASTLDRAHTELVETRAMTEEARRGAARSEELIASRTEAQRETRDRVVASRDALGTAVRAKAGALASVRQDRATYLAEAEGLAARSAELAATIAAARSASAATSTESTRASSSSSAQLSWPVAGPVTSGFGSRWGRMHEGIDIAVGSGTAVQASAAGTVIYAGWMSGYGNIIVIDHGNGLSTAYGHNTSLTVGQGTQVDSGSIVARSGSTGHSTGPHVHFEVRINGAPVDPLAYLR